MSSSALMEKESTSKVYSGVDLQSEPPWEMETNIFSVERGTKSLTKS